MNGTTKDGQVSKTTTKEKTLKERLKELAEIINDYNKMYR